VVGGGVYGCAVAYELARAGVSVTLFERRSIAAGASGGPGLRGIRATGRDPRELPILTLAYARWPQLAEELGGPTGFVQAGGLVLFDEEPVSDRISMTRLRARVAMQNALNIPSQLLDAKGLRELEAGVGDSVAGAIYTPLDGVVNHTSTTESYARAARRQGARVFVGEAVVEIQTSNEGGAVITSTGRVWTADRAIVVLANHYSAGLLSRSFGLELPTWLYNPQATIVRAREAFGLSHLVNHQPRRFSAKAIAPDLVMLTGNAGGVWNEHLDKGYPDPAVTAGSLADAPDLFPALNDAEVVTVDASRADSVSIDDIPIIDQVPSAPTVYFGIGWSGHGFAIAPQIAQSLAAWIRSGNRPGELAPFGLSRLAQQVTRAGVGAP
jgi:sarcosine oxidase subunit beta